MLLLPEEAGVCIFAVFTQIKCKMSIKVFVECFAAAVAQLGSSRVIGVAISLLCSLLVSMVSILLCILSAPGPNEENVNKELSDTPQCIHLHSFAPGVPRTHQTPRIGLNCSNELGKCGLF